MKHVILLVAILISGITSAQQPIEKSIGDFTELKVYDLIEVELVNANENKVVITGNNSEEVLINNKNGTLKIKMNIEKIFDGNKTKVVLYYKAIDVIDVNEGAKAYSKETIKQYDLDLRAQEGGTIDVPVKVKYMTVKAVTGGKIKSTGNCESQTISLLTGGVYNGEALETEKTEVTINAAGEAHINATKLADIKIRAGGDVYIYGNPETVNESKVLGGRISRVN